LLAVRKALVDGDLATMVGLPDLKIRFARNRYVTRGERPAVSIAFVSDEPTDGDGAEGGGVYLNPDELLRSLGVDLIVDAEVETEASAEAGDLTSLPPDTFDGTGLATLSWILDCALLILKRCMFDPLRDTTDLGKMADWVGEVSIEDDEDLADDDGRLVGRANVLYRTSSQDPTVLLKRD
jgi:hypothetical protein